MKNLYKLLNISPKSSSLEIIEAFKRKCLASPENTFLYTKALSILTNKIKRLYYDAAIYHLNISNLFEMNSNEEIDEYELIPLIEWLEYFKDYFYDTKYLTTNPKYHQLIEAWYEELTSILDNLKENVQSFYLI